MEAFLFILLGGVALGVLGSHKRVRIWKAAAELCGLRVVESNPWKPWAKARGGEVEVCFQTLRNPGTSIVLQVAGPPELHEVTLKAESPFEVRDVPVGESFFDRDFSVLGPELLVCALFDEETRRLILAVNGAGRLELSSGELRAQVEDGDLPHKLLLLLELRQRLAAPLDIPWRLAENATRDVYPEVRLRNLLLLLRELPDHPATAEALRAAHSDRSPEVRLRAAKELGAEGHAILWDLAEDPEDDAVSAQALSALESELTFERAAAILDRASSRRSLQTAAICLKVVGRGGAAAVEPLARALASEESELAVAAARGLGATGSPAAEPPLIEALRRDDLRIQVAAARALGRVGSTAAVVPLQEAAERHSWLEVDIKQAARQAIAEIQARLQGASPGQLSLAGSEEGQLSLADDPAGRLALGDEGKEG